MSLDGQTSKKRVTQVAWDKIKKYAATVKRTGKKYKDIAFALSRSLELADSETLYKTVEIIVQNGGRYATKLAKCKVYIYGDEAIAQDVAREKRVDELVEQGAITKINVKQFLEENI